MDDAGVNKDGVPLMAQTHPDLSQRHKVLSERRSYRCDHCRKLLGGTVRRYGGMRFCSADCVTTYQRRLDVVTKAKISLLRAA
jgi:hypothetical protein